MNESLNNMTKVKSKTAQVEAVLLHNIKKGVFKIYHPLPSETTLVKEFDVSRVTVRRAIRNLIQKGIIKSQAGAGHVIQSITPKPNIGILFGHDFFDPQSVPFHGLLIEKDKNLP